MKLTSTETKLFTSVLNNADLFGTELKIIIALIENSSLTQKMLADRLNIKYSANITDALKKLQNYNYIVIDRTEGRNKFYKLNSKFTESENVLKGQLTL